MTTDLAPPPATRTATPRQLDWLRGELAEWTRDGLLEPRRADVLLQHYRATRRVSVVRLLLAIGSGFIGIGLIWLVAANLDQLSPLGRFLALAVLWSSLLVGGETLAQRYGDRSLAPRAAVAAVRFLAALAFGALIFQAAQSLQVPAWEPTLLGCWAAGALVHAYAVRSAAPLVVALSTGLAWFLWVVMAEDPSSLGIVLALLAAAGLAVGLGAVHTRWLPGFAAPWREVGALLALAALFAAALPMVTTEDFTWSPWLAGGLVCGALAAGAGALRARGTARLEPVAVLAVAATAVALVLWDTGADTADVTAADWLHALLSTGAYVVVAVAVAVLGTLRDSWRLTALAATGLVAFTTFQSFAVFARIIEGAWLFLLLGLVLLGTGFLFDRARRGLANALEGELR